MIPRAAYLERIDRALGRNPVVVLVGPRQCGKTTLARQRLAADSLNYFDLESPVSLARLEHPQLALEPLRGLVVIDEVQHRPDLFPLLRVLCDREGNSARFLLLGSVSPKLMKGASESLAGRVETIEITPFQQNEVGIGNETTHWFRGGFPRSFLAGTDEDSTSWRLHFIQRFLQQDIPQFGIRVSPVNLKRFWTMLAHYHGQTWNGSEIGGSLGLGGQTTRSYLDILTETYMIRQLPPWHENIGKRQRKAPKIYFRDSGLFHALLGVRNPKDLLVHPKLGASWEGYAIEETLRSFEPDDAYFWSVHNGPELDLLCFKDGARIGFEVKYADAPRLTHSMRKALELLRLDHLYVIHPGRQSYPLSENADALPLPAVREIGRNDH